MTYTYTLRLVWFNEAATFLEYCTGREPSSSLDKSQMTSVESSEDIDGDELEGISSKTFVPAKSSSEGRSIPSVQRKKQKDVNILSAMEKLEDLKKGVREKDEFDYFGMNIAHQLRNLSIQRTVK
ncbi:unnamed protein product [Acanthoscelides obtectus]|uniref:Uncharacterized protein n=1 Tax=Acanthoscelides obtectus TaxID=200917 RepID=A0A9P0KM37_ACAOB|nr:unnamed protein product [Acanthoscelides obtectus]CAK1641937.1 hypothetical protein AOBTE_LOCUS12737 [Acanthoscelides obtectus]